MKQSHCFCLFRQQSVEFLRWNDTHKHGELDWCAAFRANVSKILDARLRVGPNIEHTSNLNVITYVQRPKLSRTKLIIDCFWFSSTDCVISKSLVHLCEVFVKSFVESETENWAKDRNRGVLWRWIYVNGNRKITIYYINVNEHWTINTLSLNGEPVSVETIRAKLNDVHYFDRNRWKQSTWEKRRKNLFLRTTSKLLLIFHFFYLGPRCRQTSNLQLQSTPNQRPFCRHYHLSLSFH